jgi:hypothetical protein
VYELGDAPHLLPLFGYVRRAAMASGVTMNILGLFFLHFYVSPFLGR